jgi:hypothetical protein
MRSILQSLPVALGLLIFIFSCFSELTYGQRNAAEEAICSKFLTSPKSSPLVQGLPRDLKYDEDAEFSCELVLQDRYLPAQIRLTIHEGLFYLAVTHTLMGMPRARDALRHAEVLTEMVPQSFRFRYNAGQWSLSQEISNAQRAAEHFHECLYGRASNDTDPAFMTENILYLTKRNYIKSLSIIAGREEEALQEAMKAMKEYPLDFELAFFVKDILAKIESGNSEQILAYITHLRETIAEVISPEDLSRGNSSLMVYEGLMPPSQRSVDEDITVAWQPQKLSSLPTVEEFQSFVNRREPFVVSFGSLAAMDEGMDWKVKQWIDNPDYLIEAVGDEEMVTAEGIMKSRLQACTANQVDTTACGQYGVGLHVRRRQLNFKELMTNHFTDANMSYYLNIQDAKSGHGPFRTPLHKVAKDINPYNNSFLEVVMPNITNIQLWKGESLFADQITTSRLHVDAADNLYFLLQGRKQFTIWAPNFVGYMNTIGPSYGVNKDGLEYQFNTNNFKEFVVKQLRQENKTLEQVFSTASSNDQEGYENNMNYKVLKELLSKQLEYLTDDLHFSMLSTNPGSTLWDSQQCYDEVNPSGDGAGMGMTECGKNRLPIPSAIIDLYPGDLLFLPAGWFHQVKSFSGPHTAVNYWWKPPYWRDAVATEDEIRTNFHSQLWNKFVSQQ